MNEASARHVILTRAFETAESPDKPWSDADAAWASRAAAEVVGTDAEADRFLARRGALAAERLGERDRKIRRIADASTWHPWSARALIAGTAVAGVLTDAIGPAQQVNILAFPLLGLLGWNLVVYLIVALRALGSLTRSGPRRLGPVSRLVARLAGSAGNAVMDVAKASPAALFRAEWARVSAPLTVARVGRVMHLSAMAFALGAIAALYLRGLVFEYHAGWESTFLDAGQVQQILALVLGPAAAFSGLTLPDAAHLEAIRFSVGPGENAASWIHLYAVTIAGVVLLPRALLALMGGLMGRRLEKRFPLPLGDAYFQRLLRGFTGQAARVHCVPYSYELSPASALALRERVAQEFGPRGSLTVAPCVAFGDEDTLPDSVLPASPATLVLPLFSLTATPEAENHGAFLAALASRLPPGTPLAALVDESGFHSRFEGQGKRLEERRSAWRRLLEQQDVAPLFIDLERLTPDAHSDILSGILDHSARKGGPR